MSSTLTEVVRALDFIIALCYFFIPTAILLFVAKSNITLTLKGGARTRRLALYLATSVIVFFYACGAVHMSRFTLLYDTPYMVTAVFLAICACASLHTTAMLAINMRSILLLVNSIEVTSTGKVSELKTAYTIAEEYICDMLSVHRQSDYRFLQVNDACSAYGYEPTTLLLTSLLDLVHPEDRPSIEAGFTSLEDDDLGRAFIYRLLTARGVYIYVESSCKVGRWDEQPASFLVTRNVQTRLDQFRQDTLLHVDAARVETNRIHAATLAHDLRTSLSIFDLCVREIRLGGNIKDALESADGSLWYMKYILDRTIESCRVLQGHKPVPHLEEVHVRTLIEHVLNMLTTYPRSVSITCDMKPDVDARTVLCDPDWFVSIMTSFISNAFDNTMYGQIRVTARIEKEWMIFEIADTGIGLSTGDLNQLFCPFTKVYSKVKIEHGIGIGLYNCAWRVRLLGGTYGARNNPDGGCTFHFSLPLSQKGLLRKWQPLPTVDMIMPLAASVPVQQLVEAAPDMSHIKILIVDDVQIFRKLLRKQLERRGVKFIDEAADGVEALSMLKTNVYSVAIMDVMMPLMNGDACARALREWESLHHFAETPIILMSADVLPADNDILSSGTVQHFCTKPLNIIRLGNTLREIAVDCKVRSTEKELERRRIFSSADNDVADIV